MYVSRSATVTKISILKHIAENNRWSTRIHLREVPPRHRYNKRYAEVLAKTSKRAQNVNPPLFIPTLTRLRRACFNSLALSLQGLEERLEDGALDSCKRQEIVSEATGLLRQMGKQPDIRTMSQSSEQLSNCADEMIESEARLLQLENPEYASSCGLSVVHFEKKDPIVRERTGSWIMMSKAWGVESNSVIDAVRDDATASSVLSKYHQQEVKVCAIHTLLGILVLYGNQLTHPEIHGRYRLLGIDCVVLSYEEDS